MREAATVWLVGMMGAGKSAVGRALARRLARPFVDTDAEVERDAGQPIAVIFEREGEDGFRARERDAIAKVAGTRAVVALGGGAIAQPGMAALLARTGTVVHLRARAETLLERVGSGSERPFLAGRDRAGRLARLRELVAEREPHYATASMVLDTDGREIDELVELLARRLSDRPS